jgi:hypothetical protein
MTKRLLSVSPIDKVFTLKPFQRPFVLSNARHPAFISGWGTGKSLTGIGRAMRLSSLYPGNLGVIFRKEFTDLESSTMKDFTTYTGIPVKSRKSVILPESNSEIMFLHIEELNNIQNINLGWFWIEQAEELETDLEFFTLFGRLRRANCQHSGFITANANGHNWIFRLWLTGELDRVCEELRKEKPEIFKDLPINYKFSEAFQANTFENEENLPASFILGLEVMRKSKPALYNRFVMNSHEEADTVDQILRQDWIETAVGRVAKYDPKSIVVCDPARYGDDEHVIYALQGNKTIDSDIYTNKSTMETAGRMLLMAKKHGIRSLALDVIGVGAGIADRLKELGHKVIEINSACASSEPEKYKNLRAEMWAKAAEKFENNLVSIPKDEMLKEELAQMRYKTIESSGKLQVEAKEDYKKRMGRSPNRADAEVMGLWAVDSAMNVIMNYGSRGEPYTAKHRY